MLIIISTGWLRTTALYESTKDNARTGYFYLKAVTDY